MDILARTSSREALVQDVADLRSFAWIAAIIAIPVAVFFAIELSTQRNLFAVFGGVREITWIRDDRLRCQGAFSHPILAGVFWAAIGALTMGAALDCATSMARRHASRRYVPCVLIVGATASSTPVLGLAAGVGFWLCWPIRWLVPYAFIATPFLLVALHLVMEAPVWHLISRVSAVGGSTSWHRYHLINEAINHFPEWAILGTTSTAHWGEGLFDITNQFILEGVRHLAARTVRIVDLPRWPIDRLCPALCNP